MKNSPEYNLLSENAILISFEQVISKEVLFQVMALDKAVNEEQIYGVIETVPAYASLAVYFDPLVWEMNDLIKRIKTLEIKTSTQTTELNNKTWEVPVCYEAEYAPDMEKIINHSGLSRQEIIEIHSGKDYLVYMLGFLPGFIYLGGLDRRLHIPRKEVPDLTTASGSIAIGGNQTGIYSLESPAGWNIIGRTAMSFFNPKSNTPFPIKQGDKIQFTPIPKI